jgi:hypothetical protein
MTLSPNGTAEHQHLPTRRELRAAERAREQAAHAAEEAAKQQFIAEYEASRLAASEPADPFNDTGFGFDDGTDPYAHPASDKSSAFYASGAPEVVFDGVPAAPVALEPEKPAPVTQTTVNYLAIGGIAAALAAAATTFIPGAGIAALPLGILALVLAVIGLAKRRGSATVPAIALIIALAASGWAGWHQFHSTEAPTAATATALTVTSTGGNATVKDIRFGTTRTSPGTVPMPYSTSGTGDAAVTAEPATSGDTLTCTINAPGLAPVHEQGKPGEPVTCTAQPTKKDTP